MTKKILICPECSSERVTTEHHQMFMVNTGKHWCHSMKTQDSDSPATCLDCNWTGLRYALTPKEDTPMTPDKTPTLLPCPFCGSSTIEHHEVEGRANHSFECCECLASSMCKPTYQEALEAWNRRTTQTTQAQAVPLTDVQRDEIWDQCKYDNGEKWTVDWENIIDAVERYHGIKKD